MAPNGNDEYDADVYLRQAGLPARQLKIFGVDDAVAEGVPLKTIPPPRGYTKSCLGISATTMMTASKATLTQI